jgi:hypothetical protein
VIVHVVAVVCTIAIAEMFVQVKSVPRTSDSVEHSSSSSPVNVNVSVADAAVAPERVSVTLGAVESIVTVVADAADRLSAASTA